MHRARGFTRSKVWAKRAYHTTETNNLIGRVEKTCIPKYANYFAVMTL